jgi:hypothetical protein
MREAGCERRTIVECIVSAAIGQFELFMRNVNMARAWLSTLYADFVSYLAVECINGTPSLDRSYLLLGEVYGHGVREGEGVLPGSKKRGREETNLLYQAPLPRNGRSIPVSSVWC